MFIILALVLVIVGLLVFAFGGGIVTTILFSDVIVAFGLIFLFIRWLANRRKH